MSYFDRLPKELITEICYYLNYIQINVLSEELSSSKDDKMIQIDYRQLFAIKYPTFYKVIEYLKSNDREYKDYTYEMGYNLIDHEYSMFHSDIFKSNNLGIILASKFSDRTINEIIYSYRLLIDDEVKSYYKYKKYFPSIKDRSQIFYNICLSKYQEDNEINVVPCVDSIHSIYLKILCDSSLKSKYTYEQIKNIKYYSGEDDRLVLQCIRDYIKDKVKINNIDEFTSIPGYPGFYLYKANHGKHIIEFLIIKQEGKYTCRGKLVNSQGPYQLNEKEISYLKDKEFEYIAPRGRQS